MKFLCRRFSIILLAASLGAGLARGAAEEKSVEFQGTVSAVNLEEKTITVRARQKDFVFQINPERCKIVQDGRSPEVAGAQAPALSSAQIGDSVVGRLVVENEKPVVTHLYLTSKPEKGVRVAEKPGFIISPYHLGSPPEQAATGKGAIDVRGYRRGSMLVDEASGKIFLVP